MLTRQLLRQSLHKAFTYKSQLRYLACGIDPNVKTKRQEVLQRRQNRQVIKINKNRGSLINDSLPKISITNNGWDEIISSINDEFAFYLSAESSGSSCGFEYDFKLLSKEDINEQNTSYITHPEKDIKVYIDKNKELLLLGSKIDYKEKDYKAGRYESGFVITGNESLSTNCSCNRSFKPIDL